METVEIRAETRVIVTAQYPKELWDKLKASYFDDTPGLDMDDFKHDMLCDFLTDKEICRGDDPNDESNWVKFHTEMWVGEFEDVEIEGDDTIE